MKHPGEARLFGILFALILFTHRPAAADQLRGNTGRWVFFIRAIVVLADDYSIESSSAFSTEVGTREPKQSETGYLRSQSQQ